MIFVILCNGLALPLVQVITKTSDSLPIKIFHPKFCEIKTRVQNRTRKKKQPLLPRASELIHCGLVTPYCDKDLSQYWLRLLPGTSKPLYLKQCWLITIEVFRHSPERNFTRNGHKPDPWNVFRDYIFEITSTSPRGQWVKWLLWSLMAQGLI